MKQRKEKTMESKKQYKQGPKEKTVIEVLIRFLGGEDAGAPAPLVSNGAVLESYGVPIARWDGEKVTIVELSKEQLIPVRAKHRRWLEVMAQDRNVSVEYEQE
jgi:hypothetical protein